MALSMKQTVYHLVHCVAFISIIFVWIYLGSSGFGSKADRSPIVDPWQTYGWLQTALLYFLRSLVLLSLPLAIFNFLGLILFNAFPDKKITIKVHNRSNNRSKFVSNPLN